jgi:putative DNA-invertase from lambdoid prophage Rac
MTKRPAGDRLARHLQPPSPRKRAARSATAASSALPGRCYGYARVSTVQQASDGESLDVQQRQLAGYAQMNDLVVDKVFVERGVSGSKPLGDRPQGAALLAVLKPGDVVITPKLDRMFRSALDALDVLGKLKEQGVSLHMIDLGGDTTGNGVSKLVFTILSAVAEAERDRIRERITEVKQDQRRRGEFLGGIAPYGFRRVGRSGLEPISEKQRFIQLMVRLRTAEPRHSLRAVQAKLAEQGETVSLLAIDRAVKSALARKVA